MHRVNVFTTWDDGMCINVKLPSMILPHVNMFTGGGMCINVKLPSMVLPHMNVFAMGEWGCIKVKLLPMIVPRVNVSNVYYRDVCMSFEPIGERRRQGIHEEKNTKQAKDKNMVVRVLK